jgi:hypothetical protein
LWINDSAFGKNADDLLMGKDRRNLSNLLTGREEWGLVDVTGWLSSCMILI